MIEASGLCCFAGHLFFCFSACLLSCFTFPPFLRLYAYFMLISVNKWLIIWLKGIYAFTLPL